MRNSPPTLVRQIMRMASRLTEYILPVFLDLQTSDCCVEWSSPPRPPYSMLKSSLHNGLPNGINDCKYGSASWSTANIDYGGSGGVVNTKRAHLLTHRVVMMLVFTGKINSINRLGYTFIVAITLSSNPNFQVATYTIAHTAYCTCNAVATWL